MKKLKTGILIILVCCMVILSVLLMGGEAHGQFQPCVWPIRCYQQIEPCWWPRRC